MPRVTLILVFTVAVVTASCVPVARESHAEPSTEQIARKKRDKPGNEDVRRFLIAIKNDDDQERAAIVSLWQAERNRAKEAIPALREACGGEDPAVMYWCFHALQILGEEGKPDAARLVKVLKESRGRRREWAVALVSQMGPSAAEAAGALADVTRDETEAYGLRLRAAMALEKIGPMARNDVTPLLEGVMTSDRGFLSSMPAQAFLTLKAVHREDAIPFLLRTMTNKSRPVMERAGAARVWARFLQQQEGEVAQAYVALTSVIIDEGVDRLVRAEAAKAMGFAKLDEAMAGKALSLFQRMLKEKESEVRNAAILGIRCLGPVGFPQLLELLDSSEREVFESATQSLRMMRGEAVPLVETLAKRLEDGDRDRRCRVIYALNGMGEHARRAKAAIVRALDDPDLEVRMIAKETVDRLVEEER